jgi:hypothetical protein
MLSMLHQMSIVALLSLLVSVVPAVMGAAYAFRPSEARLALMRPLSLAGLFGALCGVTSGVVSALRYAGVEQVPPGSPVFLIGLAESLVPLFVAFGSLTIGWLLVALGLRRTGN